MFENAFVFSVYGQARRMLRSTRIGGSMYEVATAGSLLH